jgi:hypothetical protein
MILLGEALERLAIERTNVEFLTRDFNPRFAKSLATSCFVDRSPG